MSANPRTLLEHLRQRYLEQPEAFTLRILLLGGNKMNVKVFEVLDDGLVTTAGEHDDGERRFIPLSSIIFFDVEW